MDFFQLVFASQNVQTLILKAISGQNCTKIKWFDWILQKLLKLETFFKAKGHEIFDPQLPDEKLQAIDAIGFGIVDKIYLEFSEPVFNSTFDWNYFLYNDEGISYSAEDAANDWTRFLAESFIVDSSLTSLWLSGKLLHGKFGYFSNQNFYWNSLKNPDFCNHNSLYLSTDKKSSKFLKNLSVLQEFLV